MVSQVGKCHHSEHPPPFLLFPRFYYWAWHHMVWSWQGPSEGSCSFQAVSCPQNTLSLVKSRLYFFFFQQSLTGTWCHCLQREWQKEKKCHPESETALSPLRRDSGLQGRTVRSSWSPSLSANTSLWAACCLKSLVTAQFQWAEGGSGNACSLQLQLVILAWRSLAAADWRSRASR